MVHQVPDVAVVLRIDDGAELTVGHGQQDSLGRSLPHSGSSLELDGSQPGEEIVDRWPLGHGLIKHAGFTEEPVKSGDEQADDAFTAQVGGGDDVDDEFDPDVRLAAWRWDQRIEPKRSDVAPECVHAQVRLN